MKYCSKCGTALEDDARFCASCGSTVDGSSKGKSNDFSERLSKLNDTKDSTSSFDASDIKQNKAMAILAYISWLVLIPLFAAKQSKFARYHVNQGLILAIVEVAYWIAEIVIGGLCGIISVGFGIVVSSLLGLANIAFVALMVLGIVNASKGKAKELPFIGKYTIIK